MVLSVALLRAINVGTANRVRMDALRAAFHAAGYLDATTYIQTGNVVFTATDDEQLTRARIEQLIDRELGLSIVAILRTGPELQTALSRNPLLQSTPDLAHMYVAFLSGEPSGEDVDVLNALSFGDDRFAVVGREVFVQYSVRSSQSKLTAAMLEKKLRRSVTVRNWSVVTALAELSR